MAKDDEGGGALIPAAVRAAADMFRANGSAGVRYLESMAVDDDEPWVSPEDAATEGRDIVAAGAALYLAEGGTPERLVRAGYLSRPDDYVHLAAAMVARAAVADGWSAEDAAAAAAELVAVRQGRRGGEEPWEPTAAEAEALAVMALLGAGREQPGIALERLRRLAAPAMPAPPPPLAPRVVRGHDLAELFRVPDPAEARVPAGGRERLAEPKGDLGAALWALRLLAADELSGGRLLGAGRRRDGAVALRLFPEEQAATDPSSAEGRPLVAAWAVLCRGGALPWADSRYGRGPDERAGADGTARWLWIAERPRDHGDTGRSERLVEAVRLGHGVLVVSTVPFGEHSAAEVCDRDEELPRPTRHDLCDLARLATGEMEAELVWPLDRDPASIDTGRARLASRYAAQGAAAVLEALARLAKPVAIEDPAADARRAAAAKPRTLDDLPGLGEAGRWGRQAAAELAKYRAGKLPWSALDKGILLEGPPGTGKTSFASALAATAGVPLVRGNLAEWESARANERSGGWQTIVAMKETFAAARAAALREGACVLFIDELDSLPVRRPGGHNDSYFRPLVNALLELLDGGEGRPGVVVVGATNDSRAVDPAVRRPGRLDRHVRIPRPDQEAMKAILAVVLRRAGEAVPKDLALPAAMAVAASGTGADAEQWVRDAARRARREGRGVTAEDLVGAVAGDGGADAAEDAAAAERARRAAAHEAGHAVLAELLMPGCVEGASIRLDRQGTASVQVRMGNGSEADLGRHLAISFAGRAAEALLFGSFTAGSGGDEGSDLHGATVLATAEEASLGMGDGPERLLWRCRHDDTPRMMALLDADPGLRARVCARLEAAEGAAAAALRANRDLLGAVAEALLARKVLTGDGVREAMAAAEAARRGAGWRAARDAAPEPDEEGPGRGHEMRAMLRSRLH